MSETLTTLQNTTRLLHCRSVFGSHFPFAFKNFLDWYFEQLFTTCMIFILENIAKVMKTTKDVLLYFSPLDQVLYKQASLALLSFNFT